MVLVDPMRIAYEQLEGLSKAIHAGGGGVVQLRGKDCTGRELVRYGRRLRETTRHCHLSLIVNDRVDVALACNADGVHVGQTDIDVRDVRRIAPRLVLGLSISSIEEWCAITEMPDYVGLGPVFPTKSKTDANLPLGLQGLRQLLGAIHGRVPSVAIGGLSGDNAASVWQTGVDGLAVISSVVDAHDWTAASRALLAQRGR